MNNSQDKLSTFLHRYLNQNKIINKNHQCKKEKTINMDNNFKEELKQHFRELTLRYESKSNSNCEI
ncbi:hypothetical protein [Clostridium tagluense]|uniref:hypothetical protein n=1 Tax=Clostridium tagluense TaxID=360422 RepID=UPI001C0E8CDB|nr:hypothetical protein [Clostridium tagluense]MBU3130386.1 hypothetical protein [Clostridium tagluense]